MGRRKTPDAKALADKAAEIKDTATRIADAGAPAVKDFVSATGSAAREFAATTAQAAKELIEATDKAMDKLNAKTAAPRKRGRKLLKMTLALGAAGALFANERFRNAVSSAAGRVRGDTEPLPWERPTPSGNGEIRQDTPASTTTP